MFPNMEVIVQRGTHLVSLSFLNMEVIVQRGTHLVCSMFPYMEVIVQRGYTSCLFNVSLWKYGSYKGGTHLVCSMFPNMGYCTKGYTSC